MQHGADLVHSNHVLRFELHHDDLGPVVVHTGFTLALDSPLQGDHALIIAVAIDLAVGPQDL